MRQTRMPLSLAAAILFAATAAGAADDPPGPATQPAATQPAEAAPAGWPPGFMMDLLGAARKPMDDVGLRVYGAVQTGFTGRLIGQADPLPGRTYEARRFDNLRLHQLRLVLERPYDPARNFDVGGRIEGIFGGDARLTHSAGLFDKAGEGNGDAWADLYQAYGQLWFKSGPQSGLEVTGGKFITPIGFELTQAEGAPLFSHSYQFGFSEPGTHTGVKLNYVFNPRLSLYVAVVEGWDLWRDNNDAVSFLVGGAVSGPEQIDGRPRDALWWNVITGPEQADNSRDYRTVLDITYTHLWTASLSQSVNAGIGGEPGVPEVGYAKWYGLAHYLTYTFSKYVSGIWRAEWFRDEGGSRTGLDAAWYENTWGLTITPCPDHPVLRNLMLRPELRWDYSNEAAFGEGLHNQLTVGMDLVFKF